MMLSFSILLYSLAISVAAYDGFLDLVRNKPFVSIWNSPSKVCETHYGIKLNLSFFDIDVNANDSFMGDQIVIFYRDKLGLYPWINQNKAFVNGGIPQFADLQSHLYKVKQDIATYIKEAAFTGLAVIDWESWRPIFERNNYNKVQRQYVQASEAAVRLKHPDWSDDKIYETARSEFDTGARNFMETTLTNCKGLRPGGFWGFYGFPACYNYDPAISSCSNQTRSYNDQLSWMFQSSSVLVPSIYLQERFGTHTEKKLHLHGILEETSRVKQKYSGHFVPVLPYTTYIYPDSGNLYDLEDLKSSIQQTAFFGFNGVTLWGSSSWFKSRDDCENVRDYVQKTLGPFVKNVTDFMIKCSSARCSSHGRCVAKSFERANSIPQAKTTISTEYSVLLEIIEILLRTMFGSTLKIHTASPYDNFSCECYQGWSGSSCSQTGDTFNL